MLNVIHQSVSHTYPIGQAILPLPDVSSPFKLRGDYLPIGEGMNEDERVGQRIVRARKEAGLTQQELATKLGLSRPAVAQWEKGRTSPSAENLRNVATATGKQLIYFFTGAGVNTDEFEEAPKMRGQVPVISWVRAGAWTEPFCAVEEDDLEYYPAPPTCGPRAFGLRVRGESMIEVYPPGALIFVDPDVEPISGDDVVVQCERHGGAEATFKRYIVEPGVGPMLKVLNKDWREQYMDFSEDCRIVGVVMAQMTLRK
ncbi:LexA family protein [Halomonas sp. hl-4]|uniref:LexA family protein n=1 Tax=Halomonas sp. hl-4 TaxID=1761789 RepID=UPI000BBF7D58|nr:XRE family transcriptional regulator [Halomonas sp. hl-4]SNY95534.1 phage repressor protein. Serine peptidase. MEROPS family S24 [Halomonas sp. hl-4]